MANQNGCSSILLQYEQIEDDASELNQWANERKIYQVLLTFILRFVMNS